MGKFTKSYNKFPYSNVHLNREIGKMTLNGGKLAWNKKIDRIFSSLK